MDAFVETTGTGAAASAPDIVVLDLGVRAPGSSVAEALASADSAMARITAQAKEHGVAPADLQTTGAYVHPEHDREGRRVVGFLAGQSLRLRVRDRAVVGRLVAAASDAAGDTLTIDGIQLQIAEIEPLRVRAREAAFADARAKAEQFAHLAGRELGEVLLVIDSPAATPGPGGHPMMARAMAVGSAEMGVEMGEHSVSATVAVRWAWADIRQRA